MQNKKGTLVALVLFLMSQGFLNAKSVLNPHSLLLSIESIEASNGFVETEITIDSLPESMEVIGNIKADTFIGSAASLTDFPSHKRSIVITTGMIGSNYLNGVITSGSLLIFPDSINSEIRGGIPVPADWDGDTVNINILYTGNLTTGNFDINFFHRGTDIGESVNLSTGGGGVLLSSPSVGHDLLVGTIQLIPGILDIGSDNKIWRFKMRRNGQSGNDTNTGDFKFYGIEIEYNDK